MNKKNIEALGKNLTFYKENKEKFKDLTASELLTCLLADVEMTYEDIKELCVILNDEFKKVIIANKEKIHTEKSM